MKKEYELGSIIVQDTLMYRELELGAVRTGVIILTPTLHRNTRNPIPEIRHAFAHHPSVNK